MQQISQAGLSSMYSRSTDKMVLPVSMFELYFCSGILLLPEAASCEYRQCLTWGLCGGFKVSYMAIWWYGALCV